MNASPAEIVEAVRARPARAVFLDLESGAVRVAAAGVINSLHALGSHVVVLVAPEMSLVRAECVRAGADGIASRADDLRHLLACVARATRGGHLLAAGEREAILRRATELERERARHLDALATLTTREEQVLRALMDGYVAKQIARELVVSLAAIRSRIRSILTKLEVRSQIEAVTLAHRVGWPRTEPDAVAPDSPWTSARMVV